MIALFAFHGFINLILCANENEIRPHKLSDSDAYYASNNYLNLDYENLQASHHNGDGPNLFNSDLNCSDQFIELDRFLFHNQNATLDQSISHFGYMIPDSTTFKKDQELQLQASINNFYSTSILTPSHQQSFVNQANFRPIVLSQNFDQNALISNLQPFPISSGQIQEFQPKLIDSSDYKVNNRELTQFPTERKRSYVHWKPHELNDLLKGFNKYGGHWKKIINSYKFGEGRTNTDLRHEFYALKKNGRIVQTKEGRWKFINRGKLTDLVRGEGEDEQVQSKRGGQRNAELVNNKSENELDSLDRDKISGIIEGFDQEQGQKGPFFVRSNEKKRLIPWKDYEFTNLIEGINIYGTNWKKIRESLEFEQGRTSNNLNSRFAMLKKHGQVTFIEGSGWKFVNEKDPAHSGENEPSKAIKNQIQRKGQNRERPFFVEKAKKSRKRHCLRWKKRELDNVLDGVNKHGRNWKKIFDSYVFEGRTSDQLASRFRGMENMGQIVQEKGFGWKYTDSFEEKLRDKIVLKRD